MPQQNRRAPNRKVRDPSALPLQAALTLCAFGTGGLDLPMGASTTPAGVDVGWVPGEEFWGEDMGPSTADLGESGPRSGTAPGRPGSIFVEHSFLEPNVATQSAARVLAARRDRYSDQPSRRRTSVPGSELGAGPGSTNRLVARPSTGTFTTVRRNHRYFIEDEQDWSRSTIGPAGAAPMMIESERERSRRRVSAAHANSRATDNRPITPFRGL